MRGVCLVRLSTNFLNPFRYNQKVTKLPAISPIRETENPPQKPKTVTFIAVRNALGITPTIPITIFTSTLINTARGEGTMDK